MAGSLEYFVYPIIVLLVGWLGTRFYRLWNTRIRVRRIVSTDDPDIDYLIDFHSEFFGGETGDDTADIREWIRQIEAASGIDEEWAEYFLVAKQINSESGREEPIGYAFSSLHIPTKLLFIDNIAVDEKREYPVHKRAIAKMLLRTGRYVRLVSAKGILMRPVHSWTQLRDRIITAIYVVKERLMCWAPHDCAAIVAELDMEKKRRGRPLADVQRHKFQWYALAAGLRAYTIPDLNYHQPILEVEDRRIQEFRRTGILSKEGLQLIMYVPLGKVSILGSISREHMLRILEALLMEWYGDSYDHDAGQNAVYREYLEAILEGYRDTLPERIRIEGA